MIPVRQVTRQINSRPHFLYSTSAPFIRWHHPKCVQILPLSISGARSVPPIAPTTSPTPLAVVAMPRSISVIRYQTSLATFPALTHPCNRGHLGR